MKNILFIFSFVILNSSFVIAEGLSGQALIDSLEAELPKAKADTNHVNILQRLSYTYSYINPEKGIEYGNKALDLSKKLDWQVGEAASNISLGVNFSVKTDYPKALEYYLQSLEIYEELGNKNGIAASLGNIGIIYLIQSDYPKALEYYLRSLKISEEFDDKKGIANTLNNIGLIYQYQSDYPKALEYFLRSLEIEEELGDKNGIAGALGNIGLIYQNQSDYPKALEYYLLSLEIFEELGDKSGIGTLLNSIGNIYSNQSDYPKALEYYLQSLEIFEELGDKRGIANSLNNIGTFYQIQSDYPKALEYFLRSLEKKEEIGDKRGIAGVTMNIGGLYLAISQDSVNISPSETNDFVSINKVINLNNAVNYIIKSISIFKEIGELDERSHALKALADAYKQKGDYKKEAELLREYMTLKDSVFNQEKAKEIGKMEAQRETLEKEKEIEILKEREIAQENEKELITYSAAGGIGLVGIFLILIYRRLAKEKKLSNELDQKNSKIEEANIELETQQKQLEEIHYELVEKNEEVLSSIRYAETIQSAMLPWASTLKESIKNYFVIFKPKDIVSGDFYWFKKLEKGYLIAVADCTGHGVPGSMISMMGSSILDEAVLSQKLENTGDILSYLNSKMIESLNKQEEENQSRDGMDICIIRVNTESSDDSKSSDDCDVHFSGAKRPLYYLENGELKTIKGDRNSIAGEKHLDSDYEFTTNDLTLEKGTKIYLTSDGYVDQMGINGKKFGTKRFKEIITEDLPINDIYQKLESEFTSHIGKEEQRDDVTVIGLEL